MTDTAAHPSAKKSMRSFFIDSENGIGDALKGIANLTKRDSVVVFHRRTFSQKAKNQLDACPAKVEWVWCGDQGVKNSMDVQIIAELAMRLAQDAFSSGYIISKDQGYLPAVHHMQRSTLGEGHVIGLAASVMEATQVETAALSSILGNARTYRDIDEYVTSIYGDIEGAKVMDRLDEIFRSKAMARDESASCPDKKETPRYGLPDERLRLVAREDSLEEARGIGPFLASKLTQAGIANMTALRECGAVHAWSRVYELDAGFSTRWVCTFEAAICDVPLQALCSQRKDELLQEVQAYRGATRVRKVA